MGRLVKVSIELVVPSFVQPDADSISDYLNDMLYNDPEFFGDFGPENIEQINLDDGTPVYKHDHGYFNWVTK